MDMHIKYLIIKIKLVNVMSSAVFFFVKVALESNKTRQRCKIFCTVT